MKISCALWRLAGDFIGACLNRVDKTITYFKNGIDLGVAFYKVQEEQLFPCIGMQTHQEEVSGPACSVCPLLWHKSFVLTHTHANHEEEVRCPALSPPSFAVAVDLRKSHVLHALILLQVSNHLETFALCRTSIAIVSGEASQ